MGSTGGVFNGVFDTSAVRRADTGISARAASASHKAPMPRSFQIRKPKRIILAPARDITHAVRVALDDASSVKPINDDRALRT